jgi:DNA-binding transcriptional regulator YhcF (GntR family)
MSRCIRSIRSIRGVSHVLWADKPKRRRRRRAQRRVLWRQGDRSQPCGTGTSARLAHLAAKGKLAVGDRFVHESYIGSRFIGRVEAETRLGDQPAIIPSIEGSAIATGFNTIWVDRADPFWEGFLGQVMASESAPFIRTQALPLQGETVMSIVVRTLADRVFEIVREQIVIGQLPDNLPIRQDALATELGVSKIPLREALARLEQEGLLTSHANRGYFVQPMSAHRRSMRSTCFARNRRRRAAVYAAERATEADQRRMRSRPSTSSTARLTSNLAEVAVRNRDFHTRAGAPRRAGC